MGFEIINKLKKEKGMTNAQIAEAAGITLSTLDKITSGANKNPKLDTLQAICRVLGCRLDDFDDTPAPESKKSPPLESGDAELLSKYHALDDLDKGRVLGYMDRCIEAAQVGQVVEMTSFPFQAVARGSAGEIQGVAEVDPDKIMAALAVAEAESTEESNKL